MRAFSSTKCWSILFLLFLMPLVPGVFGQISRTANPVLLASNPDSAASAAAANAPPEIPAQPRLISRNEKELVRDLNRNPRLPARKAPQALTNQLGSGSPIFIANKGQFDSRVKFQVRNGNKTLWLTSQGIVFDVVRAKPTSGSSEANNGKGQKQSSENGLLVVKERNSPNGEAHERLVFSQEFVGANLTPIAETSGSKPGLYNYFIGNDPKKWVTGAKGYSQVVYRDVWQGVDLRVYGKGPDIEEEFVLHPGADLSQVQVAYRGIDKLQIDPDGSLDVVTAFGVLHESAPRVYQQIAGRQVAVNGRFKLTDNSSYSFEVGGHDTQYALVVDPTLLYSTFLGGSAGYICCYPGTDIGDNVSGISVDGFGNAYVAGTTQSTDFPTTVGAYSTTFAGGYSGFVTKLNTTGSSLIYSTYFAENDGSISDIAVDSAGNAYITGIAPGNDIPTTAAAYWPTASNQQCAQYDFFLTELNPAGNQINYSTCFNSNAAGGGVGGVAIDGFGKAYIAGWTSTGIPTTSGAYQTAYPGGGTTAFAMVVDTTASGSASLVYSTYLGQATPGNSQAHGIAVDSFGMIYLTG
jgi:hypothetical protein